MLLEIALAVSCVGTAVARLPVLRTRSEYAALGFLAARVVEAALILVGVVSLLATLSVREDVAGAPSADAGQLITTVHVLLAVYDGTSLLPRSLMPVISAVYLGEQGTGPAALAALASPLGTSQQSGSSVRPCRSGVRARHLADRQGLPDYRTGETTRRELLPGPAAAATELNARTLVSTARLCQT